jgi:hypothetical protein
MKQSSSYDWNDYAHDLIKTVMPWIVFAALALLIFIFATLIRCFIAVCCKRKILARSDRIRNIFVAFSAIVTFLAMGCCGYIIHYSDSAYQSYMQLQCSAGRIPYCLLNGNDNYNWIGLATAKDDLDYIVGVLNDKYAILTNALWDDTDWLESDTKDFQSVLNDYYSDFSDSKADSPNPYSSGKVKLNYIENLGGTSTSGTYTYQINQEYLESISPIDLTIYTFKEADLSTISQTGRIVKEIN